MKRWLVILLLFAHASTAVPQDAPPVQLAAATEETQPAVTLPDTPPPQYGALLGFGALLGLILLGISPVEQCDDSGCGPGPIGTTGTGTR